MMGMLGFELLDQWRLKRPTYKKNKGSDNSNVPQRVYRQRLSAFHDSKAVEELIQ